MSKIKISSNLTLFYDLTLEDQNYIVKIITKFFKNNYGQSRYSLETKI